MFVARRAETEEAARNTLSKQLWRALRKDRRQALDGELVRLVSEGVGYGQLKRTLEKQRGVKFISCVSDSDGSLHNDPREICEVFAQF